VEIGSLKKKNTCRAHTSAKMNLVWSPDRDDFPNLTGISLSKDMSVIKFSLRSDQSVYMTYNAFGGTLNLA